MLQSKMLTWGRTSHALECTRLLGRIWQARYLIWMSICLTGRLGHRNHACDLPCRIVRLPKRPSLVPCPLSLVQVHPFFDFTNHLNGHNERENRLVQCAIRIAEKVPAQRHFPGRPCPMKQPLKKTSCKHSSNNKYG